MTCAPMRKLDDGWYALTVPDADAGTLYQFRIDDELYVPDPASAFQPKDVNGPSEVIDHSYDWLARHWRGRPWHEAVFLELHVGAFTPEGTFRAAIDKLDHLVDIGITAIELMPVADFAGTRNWGYDGVLLFAPDSAYGRPEDLKALIDAAHARGLMVFLDVVYNHFGPEGNYLGRYAPQFFTQAETPWGRAIDYRVPEVRAFAIENALHWLREYRFDGLRLDAVHAIVEPGSPSVLVELSRAVGKLAEATGRATHLVLENDDNRASLLDPLADPPRGKYRAQWNDDYHHAWHVLLTGETDGYYRDYAQGPQRAARPHPVVGLCLPGRGVGAPQRRQAGRAERRPAADRLCRFPAKPRSDRQPRARRPPYRAGAGTGDRSGARGDAAGADAAADVHGRGMGLDAAISVFLRFFRRAGGCRAPGTQGRVRGYLSESRRTMAGSARDRDVPISGARLERVRPPRASQAPGSRPTVACDP